MPLCVPSVSAVCAMFLLRSPLRPLRCVLDILTALVGGLFKMKETVLLPFEPSFPNRTRHFRIRLRIILRCQEIALV